MIHWRRNGWPADSSAAGWHLFCGTKYIGTVFVDGSWNRFGYGGTVEMHSQPLAAQALLRAAGLA